MKSVTSYIVQTGRTCVRHFRIGDEPIEAVLRRAHQNAEQHLRAYPDETVEILAVVPYQRLTYNLAREDLIE